MKKIRTWMAVLACMLLAVSGAQASGVTLRTFTPFADMDFAAQGYMDMITRWETETGNLVEDYSGILDGLFMENLQTMLSEGTADVVVLPVGAGLPEGMLVTADELIAGTDCGARKMDAMAEKDGSVLLVPVRLYWEALYVNTDVLAQYGLDVPQTFEQLLAACAALAQNGVLPIANALNDWNEIVLDCAALMGAGDAAYADQASLSGAQEVLEALVQVKAFGGDPWSLTDAEAEQKFLSGEAAMRFDADVLAQMVEEARWDNVVVVNPPLGDGQTRGEVVGVPAFGAAITRACWSDSARSEAAVSFLMSLLEEKSLVAPVGGKLGDSIAALTAGATDMTGVLYDHHPDSFDSWAEGVIAKLMGK